MNYIELIGPPGAGKTTLLNTLADSRKDTSWKIYEEAIYNIIDSLAWDQLNTLKSKLLFLINKLNVPNYKQIDISNAIIKELAPQIAGVIQKKYEYLVEAQLQAVQSLPLQISPIDKYSFINGHMQALQQLFVLESFGYTQAVLFDEGPLNTHHGLNHIKPHNQTPDTLPNAVIYCSLSVPKNIQRIQNRNISTVKTNTIYNKLNNGHLETIVSSAHQIADSNFAFIKAIGISTFEINLTNPVSEQELEKLHNFIAMHSTTKQNYRLEYA